MRCLPNVLALPDVRLSCRKSIMLTVHLVIIMAALYCPRSDGATFRQIRKLIGRLNEKQNIYYTVKGSRWLTADPNKTVDSLIDIVQVENQIQGAQHELLCNYLFVALTHMRLVRVPLFDKKHSEWLAEFGLAKDITFKDETVNMLGTLLRYDTFGHASTDVIWILYVYAERMFEYVKSVGAGETWPRRDVYSAIHAATLAFIENEFGEVNQCGKYELTLKDAEQVGDSDDLERRLEVIVKNMSAISDCSSDDGENTETVGRQYINLKALRLNDMLDDYTITDTLFRQFKLGVDWTKIEYLVQGQYSMGKTSSYPISSQIQALGALHADMIGILKVIIFRMVWNYTKIASLWSSSDPKAQKVSFARHKDDYVIIHKSLTEFAGFLGVTNDNDMQNVIVLFTEPIPYGTGKRFVLRRTKWVLIRALKGILQKLHRGRSLKRVRLVSDYPCISIERLQNIIRENGLNPTESNNESVASVQVFTEYVKKILDGVNFSKVIMYFLLVQFSPKLHVLNSFEEQYINPIKFKKITEV